MIIVSRNHMIFELTKRELSFGLVGLMTGAMSTDARAQTPSAIWQKLTTEAYRGKQDDMVVLADGQTAWYGNGSGKLYQSLDGGDNWTKIWDQPGTFIRALGFVDTQIGFLGNVGTDYYPGVTDGHPLYRTQDGGKSWQKVMADGIERVKGICGIDILAVRRIYQGEARVSHLVHAAGRVGGPAFILRSEDSGETWKVLDLTAQAGMILDVKFLTPNIGLVCASSSSDLEQAQAMILRTEDAGKSWQVAYRGKRNFENCWKMSFPTQNIGYATLQSYDEKNANQQFIKTTNGGKSWVEMPLTEDAAARQFGIGFVDANRGFIGTRQQGFETQDGGQSWTPVPSMGPAVNKVRVVANGKKRRAFAIGLQLSRLDLSPIG